MHPDITATLHRAAIYRALSLLFVPPEDSTGAELRALAADLGAHDPLLGEQLGALAADADATLGSLYHLALGPTGAVRDCESDYEVNPLGGKGPLIADVAGFYQAFQYEDRSLHGLGVDHIATELGYLGWLALRRAFALHTDNEEGAARCAEAAQTFVGAHLGRWVATCLDRLRSRCPDTWFDVAAALTAVTLEVLEPGRIGPPLEDRRRVALPTLDDSDVCGLPPDL